MKLETASYNSAGDTHNALAEETAFLSYSINHNFNAPASAIVVLADPTGAVMQKYDIATNAVYVGPGRAKIQDPTGTCIFEGRIIRAKHDMGAGRVTLMCEDWLSQLDEHRINYDMREDLNGSGLRESTLHADPDNADASYRTSVRDSGAACHLIDDAMAWNDDDWNGYKVVFGSGMAGTNSISVGPYAYTLTGLGVDGNVDSDLWDTDIEGLWNDDANGHTTADNDESWTVEYAYRLFVPVAPTWLTSVNEARIHITFELGNAVSGTGFIDFYDNTGAAWVRLAEIDGSDIVSYRALTLDIPGEHIGDITDANGIAKIRLTMTRTAGTPALTVRYARFECDATTTQSNVAYDLNISYGIDGAGVTCYMRVLSPLDEEFVWEGLPYSIINYIRLRVNAIVTASDPLFTLNTSIDGTCDGLTTRNYQERTASEILKDLAHMDEAVFWIALADHTAPTVIWKKTFAGGLTEMTDASVLFWAGGEYDYLPMVNEYHVYGVRIGDNQLFINTKDIAGGDPGAASKTKYEATRSQVIRNTGAVTGYEVTALGAAMVTRDMDVHLYLRAEIAGLSAMRLGEEVNINSTLLGLTDAKYVITHWTYNSDSSRTSIRLHPRQSIGFITHRMFGEFIRYSMDAAKLTEADKSTPKLSTQTW